MSDIRKAFPIFKNRDRLVYLDTAASAQKPEVVINAMQEFYELNYANVHRGLYPLSEKATEAYEGSRLKVRQFIGARSEKEIIFTRNTTEAINLVAYTWAQQNVHESDVIVTTEMEHHSNYLPWVMLAKRTMAHLEILPIDRETFVVDVRYLQQILEKYGERVKLIAVSHVSNVLGTVNPISEIVALARRVKAKVMVDGAQAVAHLPIDVVSLDVDFYAFSGHKLYGPTGIGVLYAKRDLMEYTQPFLYGGEMVLQATGQDLIWKDLPWKFEAGTPSIVEAVGLAKALEFVEEIGFAQIARMEEVLLLRLMELLDDVKGFEVYGKTDIGGRIGVVPFGIKGVHVHDVADYLGRNEICIRAGHHCCQPLHKSLGLSASARISMGVYSTIGDLVTLRDRLLEMS